MGRAPQDIRFCHEGRRGPAVADRASSEELFRFGATLVCVVPRIDAVKRSACIEGARMAFACVKTYWEKMKATDTAVQSPPGASTNTRRSIILKIS